MIWGAHGESSQIVDLDDVNDRMMVLGKLRDVESEIEMKLGPIEATYAILQKYKVFVPQDEMDHVDIIQYK